MGPCWKRCRFSFSFLLKVISIISILVFLQIVLFSFGKILQDNHYKEQHGSRSHYVFPVTLNSKANSTRENVSSVIVDTGNAGDHSKVGGRSVQPREAFARGKWNSSLASKFFPHYDVNCAEIIHGNAQAVNSANKILGKIRKPRAVSVPGDEAVKQWTSDCSSYREARNYPLVPRSEEEAEFPIAYIMLTYNDPAQFERLLRAVYQPQNLYCIHPDKKSPPPFQEVMRNLAACFDNVFIASKIVTVNYAHSSRLQADINCMSDLINRDQKWNYVLNLCGQDFPLKTNLEIIRQLKAFGGHNDIPGITAPDWFYDRVQLHHEFKNGIMVKHPDRKKPPPPLDHNIFWGNAYYAATRGFAQYVIHNQTAVDLLRYSEDAYSPDEHYWVTLHRIPGVPGGYPKSTWNSTVRFIHWKDTKTSPECIGKYVRNVCVFGLGYVRALSKTRHLFANKFHLSYDPIALQCMEELLDFRANYPDSISNFVEKFPVTDMFQLS